MMKIIKKSIKLIQKYQLMIIKIQITIIDKEIIQNVQSVINLQFIIKNKMIV